MQGPKKNPECWTQPRSQVSGVPGLRGWEGATFDIEAPINRARTKCCSAYGQLSGRPVSLAARHEAEVHLMEIPVKSTRIQGWTVGVLRVWRRHPQPNRARDLGAARAAFKPLGLASKIKRGPKPAKNKIIETLMARLPGLRGWADGGNQLLVPPPPLFLSTFFIFAKFRDPKRPYRKGNQRPREVKARAHNKDIFETRNLLYFAKYRVLSVPEYRYQHRLWP